MVGIVSVVCGINILLNHDFSEDGKREISISDFFEEVFKLLKENNLI